MKSQKTIRTLTGLIASAMLAVVSHAEVTLSDFTNPFALDGTYGGWSGVGPIFTSGATAFTVQAPANGGGFKNLAPAVNASGEDAISIKLDVNPGNIADKFNIVLFDGDGTARVYRFDGIAVGPNQTLTKNVANFLQDNAPGTVPGLDLASLTAFHLQGAFINSDAMDLTFDKLSLVDAPFVPDTIINGNFETAGGFGWGTTQGTPTFLPTGGNPNGNAVLQSTGGFAVLYAFNNTEKTFASLGLAPGDIFTFQMDMKVIAGSIGGMRLEGPAGFVDDRFAPANTGGAGWATYSFQVTVPTNPLQTQSKFGLRVPDGSTVAFDNVAIVLPAPLAPAQPSIKIGKILSWNPTVPVNIYQPEESSDNSVFTPLGSAITGTAINSIFDPTPAAFYRVQEAAPTIEEVAFNGGFEDDDGVAPPNTGAIDWDGFGNQPPVRITTDFKSGVACMRMNPIGGAAAGVAGIEQNIFNKGGDITPGSNYTLSFWKKNPAAVGDGYVQQFRVVYLEDNAEISALGWTPIPTGNLGAWVKVSLPNQVAPLNATSANIQIQGVTGAFVGSFGEVLIDDVSLQSTVAGTPFTIASSSASAAEISWQSLSGKSYQVRSSTDLSGWSPLGGVITGNNTLKAVYDTPLVTKKFYQLGTQ